MIEEATKLGAEAIVSVKYDIGRDAYRRSAMMVYGTAVIFE